MYQRHELGKTGENLACIYLQKNYYEIIERNFKCKIGEIDIIAKDKNELVFVEVKTRKSKEYGAPADAVDNRKQKHIYKAANYYLYIKQIPDIYTRIDVIEVYLCKKTYYIHHIKQAIY